MTPEFEAIMRGESVKTLLTDFSRTAKSPEGEEYKVDPTAVMAAVERFGRNYVNSDGDVEIPIYLGNFLFSYVGIINWGTIKNPYVENGEVYGHLQLGETARQHLKQIKATSIRVAVHLKGYIHEGLLHSMEIGHFSYKATIDETQT